MAIWEYQSNQTVYLCIQRWKSLTTCVLHVHICEFLSRRISFYYYIRLENHYMIGAGGSDFDYTLKHLATISRHSCSLSFLPNYFINFMFMHFLLDKCEFLVILFWVNYKQLGNISGYIYLSTFQGTVWNFTSIGLRFLQFPVLFG